MSRKLIHVPIVHNVFSEHNWEFDEEFLKEPIVAAYLKEMNTFWKDVEQDLLERKVDRIYQDAFCGEEELYQKYVEKRKDSRNYNCILTLEEQGAELMPTEKYELILANSYAYHHNLEIGMIDFKRELYIAKKVDETLLSGETGVLFLGVGHSKDIQSIFEILHPEIIVETRKEPKLIMNLVQLVDIEHNLKYGK